MKKLLKILGVIALVIGILLILGIVGNLVSERTSPPLTASEQAYVNALLDHHDKMREQSQQFHIDVFDFEELREEPEMLRDVITHYDTLMKLALEGMTRNPRSSVTQMEVPGYLKPPPSMAHIQDKYNEAMYDYFFAAFAFKQVFESIEAGVSQGDESELADNLLLGVHLWGTGDSKFLQARQLLLDFLDSSRE